ncbi:MAG: RagB/SusD family nutrient uptake outer membrane protein, partial [Tannerella sp.]|nr:RagB/SusD family nutrient uptake outer membrane protein [Tannerella sp.]
MKRIQLLILATVVSGLLSCSDSLNVDPLDQLTASTFPQTDADAIAAVNGVYYINRYSTSYAYLIDLTSDLTTTGENINGAAAFLNNQNWTPSNSYIVNVWGYFYSAITDANLLIDNLEKNTTVTPSLRDRITGEAKFLRAYYYQYLVQLYGEVPLVLHKGENDEGGTIKRDEIDEIFGQIEADLIDAAAKLPHTAAYSGSDRGRATWGAAKSLLAKIYLVWGQISPTLNETQRKELYNKSVVASTEVINSNDYQLEEAYSQNWSLENRNGKENIFAGQHALFQGTDGSGDNHLSHCAFSSGFTNVKLPHVVVADKQYSDEYDPLDQRKGITYADSIYDDVNQVWFQFDVPRYLKYINPIDPNGSASYRNIDRTAIRLAEVYLLRAEAINERDHAPNATAYDDLNTVRRRAFINTPDPAAYDITAENIHLASPYHSPLHPSFDGAGEYEKFKDAIRWERKFELTYEQTRWLDLARWRILVRTLRESPNVDKHNVSAKNYRFP